VIIEESPDQSIEVGKPSARATTAFSETPKKWRIFALFSLVAFFNELNKFANCKKEGCRATDARLKAEAAA